MNIKQAFMALEALPSQSDYTSYEVGEILAQVSKTINADHVDFSEHINGDQRYKRGIFAALTDFYTIKRMADVKFTDPKYPALFSHFLISRLANYNTLQNNELADIVDIIYNNLQQTNKCGSTIGYGIGYVIGRLMYNGCDTTPLGKLCITKFVKDQDIFYKGFLAGFIFENKGLMCDKFYLSQMKDRYNEWKDSGFETCFKVLKTLTKLENSPEQVINPANEKMLWFLKNFLPETQFLNNLHDLHCDVIAKITSKALQTPEVATYIEQQIIVKANDIMNELEKNYAKKLESEVARIEKQAIENAQQILEQQAALNEERRLQAQKLQFHNKLNGML
jgi:hypothetical protein